MASESAWICGIGMVTPVGDCAAQTAASVRAGISRYQESSIYNKRFEPMTLALVQDDALPPLTDKLADLSNLTSRRIRMLRLAHLALLEALQTLPEGYQQHVPLFLSGPETMPGRPLAITNSFLSHLAIQTETNLDRIKSKLFTTGRAGGMQALEAALQMLATGEQNYVLIGGVDSYLDLYLLATLDMDNRVLANGIMDGFAPGEGAGFLLLCSDKARQSLQEKPTVKLHSPGIAAEAGHRYSDETYTGDGLANAVATALQLLNNTPVHTIFSSINGENMGAKEWGVAYIRNTSAIDPGYRFEHPADCFGDTGAAAMSILTGLAATGMKKGYLDGPAMSYCSSDGPYRGAVCMSIES
jgi:3-oxoacyl-[acyl-carrier-protein] synthase-1